jgi:hypothetical protein
MAFMIEIPNEVVSIQIWNADTITCLDPIVPFDAVASSNADNLTYQWSSVEGTIINPNQLIASASEPGVYVCTVTTVPNGCSASASYEVMSAEVYTLSDDLLIWPNVISPNQDNKNDWWAPRLITDGEADITDLFSVYDLQIRDRWGNLVFESTGSRIWRPNQVSAGVYFYTLRYAIDCGNEGEKKREGTIQIVR